MSGQFRYEPEWQGPLSGRSFEKQTEDAINGVIDRIDAITGAEPSDALPNAPGTASAGTSSKFARGDHRHPAQTSVSGSAGTAAKLQTARAIALTGDASGEVYFDGSADVAIAASIENATQSVHGLMSPADKTKLDGIADGANAYVLPQATASTLGGVYVDAALDSQSVNPVQNKAVKAALDLKVSTADAISNATIDALFA